MDDTVAKNAYYDKNGNTVFYASRIDLKKFKLKCKNFYNLFHYEEFVTISSDCKTITITGTDDLGLYIVKSESVMQYCILDQLIDDFNTDNLSINVVVMDEAKDEVIVNASWPKEDPGIKFKQLNDY